MGRKKNFDAPILREIEPSTGRIAKEVRELMPSKPGLEAWCKEFDHTDAMIRLMELEEKSYRMSEGDEAVQALREERKRSFVAMLESLEKESGRARFAAEYVTKLRTALFADEDERLARFAPLLEEMEQIAGARKAERKAGQKALPRRRIPAPDPMA